MRQVSWHLWIATVALSAGASACASISQSLPTSTPVMIGPVDHIGGQPDAVAESPSEASEFDTDNEMFILVCEESGIPTVSVTKPAPVVVSESVKRAYASLAGEVPLRSVAARISGMSVGAWVYFFAGCYGHHYWWNVDGHVGVTRVGAAK